MRAERDLQQAVLRLLGISEQEARDRVGELSAQKKWPVYFFGSDTTGEKDFEEFYTDQETVDWSRFNELGVVNAIRGSGADPAKLDAFTKTVQGLRDAGAWTKTDVLDAFKALLGENFDHKEAGKHLDQKM